MVLVVALLLLMMMLVVLMMLLSDYLYMLRAEVGCGKGNLPFGLIAVFRVLLFGKVLLNYVEGMNSLMTFVVDK